MTTNCGFYTFFAQIFRSTLHRERIPQRKEVAVLLNMYNISKAEPRLDAHDTRKGMTRRRKALGFGIFDAKCAATLPPPGTAFLRDELETNPLDEHLLVSVEPTLRLIDTDDVATQHVKSHRMDGLDPHVSNGLPRLRPAFADPSRFVTWLHDCQRLHRKTCTKYWTQFKHSLRLVNTSRLRIETFDPDSVPGYYTLSYVWDTQKTFAWKRRTLGKQLARASPLMQTFTHRCPIPSL